MGLTMLIVVIISKRHNAISGIESDSQFSNIRSLNPHSTVNYVVLIIYMFRGFQSP